MVFVTIKHAPDPTRFDKEQLSSLLSTTSRTTDASSASFRIECSSKELSRSVQLISQKRQLQHDQKRQPPLQHTPQQQSQEQHQEASSKASSGGLYPGGADFTLNEHQITELLLFMSNKRPHYQHISSAMSCSTQQLSRDDLMTGRVIGVGGFGIVQKVKSPLLKQTTSRPCVMKTCKPSSLHSIVSSVSHLMRERYFLSHLKHPHIIRMVAVSEHGDPMEAIVQSKRIDACFLILEYLPETLDDRIDTWKIIRQELAKKEKTPSWNVLLRRHHHTSSNDLSLFSDTNRDLFAQQLVVALQVTSALEYLHSQRVIFMDLKPSNVGMKDGFLKLFDFGLAVQLPKDSDLDMVSEHLVGRAGTTRYMASEVSSGQPYNVKADVFSFAILLWQIMTLKKPFVDMAEGAVYGDRPGIPKVWPSELKRIIERGWSSDLSKRPHMKEVRFVLEDLHRRVYES